MTYQLELKGVTLDLLCKRVPKHDRSEKYVLSTAPCMSYWKENILHLHFHPFFSIFFITSFVFLSLSLFFSYSKFNCFLKTILNPLFYIPTHIPTHFHYSSPCLFYSKMFQTSVLWKDRKP